MPKTLSLILEAALEDAFDEVKTLDEMKALQILIDCKIITLINKRSNSDYESPEQEAFDKILESLEKEINGDNTEQVTEPVKEVKPPIPPPDGVKTKNGIVLKRK